MSNRDDEDARTVGFRSPAEVTEYRRACAAEQPHSDSPCRSDGRCQYAIDSGAEGMGHCPRGKCVMPTEQPQPVTWIAVSDRLPANPEWHTGDGPTPDDWVLAYSETHDFLAGQQHVVMRARDFYVQCEGDDDIGTDDSKVITHWRPLDRPGSPPPPPPAAAPIVTEAMVNAAVRHLPPLYHSDDEPHAVAREMLRAAIDAALRTREGE